MTGKLPLSAVDCSHHEFFVVKKETSHDGFVRVMATELKLKVDVILAGITSQKHRPCSPENGSKPIRI